MARFIFVTGGVVSSLGKGLSSASLAYLLQSRGYKVRLRKLDPYLNVDPGTMSPFQHGEVFVTDDGAETDLDLGHYERFSGVSAKKSDNITTGKIYSDVLMKERKGKYLGKTVQVIPHITDRIKEFIKKDSSKEDFVICEIGGIVGDIESLPFVEAIRQFANDIGKKNVLFVHLTLVPYLKSSDEIKTKPTQHTVKELRGLGIIPDILVCRSENPLDDETREKLAAFCHVSPKAVVSAHDVSNIYRVPILLDEQGVSNVLSKEISFDLPESRPLLDDWIKMAETVDNLDEVVEIAMVGKYTGLSDSYLSVIKALQHSSFEVNRKLQINWIEAENLDEKVKQESLEKYTEAWNNLKNSDGIIVPGGFGIRGIEGKIKAAEYARVNEIPYLGVCLGLQIATIEFCRNVLGMENANSTEFDENTPQPAVLFMPEISKTHMGGTMRLGTKPTPFLVEDCKMKRLYGNQSYVDERHRHRYEVNPELISKIENAGLIYVGKDETGQRCEIMELENHPYYVGTQYHPEFKSRPGRPSPPFLGLLKASIGEKI